MKVGLLILSHSGIGQTLLGTASLMMGGCSLPAKVLTATRDSDPEEIYDLSVDLIQELDEGEGVLIITDLIGATPSNIAQKLLRAGQVRIVTGLNLSMLLRVLNYPDKELDELVEKAITGGIDGITEIKPE